jgi:hypothetical protein
MIGYELQDLTYECEDMGLKLTYKESSHCGRENGYTFTDGRRLKVTYNIRSDAEAFVLGYKSALKKVFRVRSKMEEAK